VSLGLAAAAVAGSLGAAGLAWAATATDSSTSTTDDHTVESPENGAPADTDEEWAQPGGPVTGSNGKPHATSGGS